jgi:hypothetical protein
MVFYIHHLNTPLSSLQHKAVERRGSSDISGGSAGGEPERRGGGYVSTASRFRSIASSDLEDMRWDYSLYILFTVLMLQDRHR